MWGDVALFTGRFDRIEDQINGFPTYKASRSDLKLFFSKASGYNFDNFFYHFSDLFVL